MERSKVKRRHRSSKNDIVATIFGSSEKCTIGCKTKPVLRGCQSVKRLIYGLRYFTILTQKRRDQESLATFSDFIQTVWRNYINDIVHLSVHEKDLEQIHHSLFTEYGLKKCDLKRCKLSARHCQINRKDGNDGTTEFSNFLGDCFDAIHYYLFHLYDVRLRTSRTDIETDDADAQATEDAAKYIDSTFWMKKRTLKSAQKEFPKFFAPFNMERNKFTIYGRNGSSTEGQATYSEQFVKVMAKSADSVDGTNRIRQYLMVQGFDTEAIKEDVGRYPDSRSSNIYALSKDEKSMKAVTYFVNKHQLHSMGFCTGLAWMYWPAFAPKGDPDEKQYDAVQWHGYTKRTMYSPTPKYGNFKWEMLQYDTMTMRKWKKISVKVDEYMRNCDVIRALRAWFGTYYGEWAKQYGIHEDAPIDADHLYAVIIFCDLKKICAMFAESFRRTDPTEDLDSIKKRNQAFWWMSKRLRELVEVFGEDNFNSNHSQRNNIYGPFYCNVGFVATVPSFSVVFRGPTSTTKQLDVAMAFGNDGCMIVELANEHYPGEEQRFFNTSWISIWKEEDERVTIGGQWPLQIVSIRITSTNQNFESLLHPLYWFDHLLSGTLTNNLRGKWKDNTVDFISQLIDYADSNDRKSTRFPQYILDVFDHWRFSKKRIKIKTKVFEQLWYQGPPKVLQLFVHSFGKKTFPDEENPRVNLLTKRILNLFPELEFLNILDDKSYPFDLTLFIETLSRLDCVQRGNFQCVVKGGWVRAEYQKILIVDSGMFQIVLGGKALHIQKRGY